MKEAYLYEKKSNNTVRCSLCAHKCIIKENRSGICHVRQNKDGQLFSLTYERIIASNLDPVEKKPLFHFHPGTKTYSIAAAGCNFICSFCQNFNISQIPRSSNVIPGEKIGPESIVEAALNSGADSISYTYTEPTIYFELAYDTAKLASNAGLQNIFVSNGFMTEECIDKILPYLHAINIDLKSYSNDFYKNICGAKLEPVLKNIGFMYKKGVWVEVTTLLINGYNDSYEEIENLSNFLVDIDPYIPWHISRFHPDFKFTNVNVTNEKSLLSAMNIGLKNGLKYIYIGNVLGNKAENTFCHKCGNLLIARRGFTMTKISLESGNCNICGTKIPGIWI